MYHILMKLLEIIGIKNLMITKTCIS